MRQTRRFGLVTLLIAGCSISGAFALKQPSETGRFGALVVTDPSQSVSATAVRVDASPAPQGLRSGWSAFRDAAGPGWELYYDARSGAPLLAQGEGIPWIPGTGNSISTAAPVTLDSLEISLRSFVAARPSLFLAKDSELALNREGSGQITPDLWQVVFERAVGGVPVVGDGYVFYIGHGNLIAFGASRWSAVKLDPAPMIGSVEAMTKLVSYMGLTPFDSLEVLDEGSLEFAPMSSEAKTAVEYAGPVGEGYRVALTWRIVLRVAGETGTWVGRVDANTGDVIAFFDDNRYAQVKGGVFPLTDDGICPSGCEQANYPMPFPDVKINGSPAAVNAMGSFTCSPVGGAAVMTLSGQYVKVVDTCGTVSLSTTCDASIDLKTSSGTDCVVPSGTSAGDTHSARSSFYHLNRIKEHARAWLPANTWLTQQLTDNINLMATCNAFWDGGSVNFYRSGGGCRNTGEISGVFLHEWGHGLSQNDGAGSSNPDEAYADITSFLLTHTSCLGRGFLGGNCSGYGNACLNCTGVREIDWNQRASHAPSTPEGFIAGCPGGGSPCGKEAHCEGYLPGETLWDLAARDLPAAGIDANTSWQLVDRMWYKSRTGTSGAAYSCGSPASNRSCAATAWMTQLRVLDDDDGNLANGTPHAAAIFAAFSRHNITCGAVGDASNQSTTICPSIAAPTVSVIPSSGSVAISWAAVPNASSYVVLKTDQGCSAGFTIVGTTAGTSFTDNVVVNGFPESYAVQAVGSNSSCLSPVSTCSTVTPGGPHSIYQSNARVADTCSFGGDGNNDGLFDAGEQIQFSITLKNDGTGTLTGVTATITSSTSGVSIVDGTASYPDIPFAGTGTSLAPNYTVQLGTAMSCGATILYQIAIHANEGDWTGTYTQRLGLSTPTGGTALPTESFSGGIPGTWTVVDGGSGGGAAATWTTANPGSRTAAAPIASPFAIVDSAFAGGGAIQDEQLIAPTLDLSSAVNVTLDFDQYFNWSAAGLDEKGDVDVMSSKTGGGWANVFRNQGASSANPNHRTINIAASAGGASNVQIRFRYYSGSNENWWQVDNVGVTYTGQTLCAMHACVAADLSVTKGDAPDPVSTGSNVMYSETVSNAGPNTATSVQLSDTTPANTTFQSLVPAAGWSCQTPPVGGTGAITCTRASVNSGTSGTFTIGVKVDYCIGNGSIASGTASVSSATMDLNMANNSANSTTTVNDSGACNDGNACTVQDTCSGSTCSGVPAPPPNEVNSSVAVTESGTTATIAWSDAPGPFNVYRGQNGPSTAWVYNQTCFASSVPSPVTDTDLPTPGTTFFYLVTRTDACGGESVPGYASNGSPIVNPSACQ